MNLQDAVQQVIHHSVQADHRLLSLLKQLTDPANGRVIQLPTGPQTINGPSMAQVLTEVILSMRTILEGQRCTYAMLNEVFKRLAPGAAQAGPTDAPEPLAQGGSQSPDFKQGAGNGHPGSGSQGCNQHGSPDTPGAGNP